MVELKYSLNNYLDYEIYIPFTKEGPGSNNVEIVIIKTFLDTETKQWTPFTLDYFSP